jgi:cyanophycinase
MTSRNSGAGLLALVGSGEYLPVMHEVENLLLHRAEEHGRPRRYVQLATAAAREGEATLRHWHDLGADAARRLNAEQIIIDVRNRTDADRVEHVHAITDAGLIYLSGGDPVFLAETLRDTAVGNAILREWRAGASLAGCSAGAMALCSFVPDIRRWRGRGVDGLGAAEHLRVLPHFDRWAGRMPDMLMRAFMGEQALVGIDEDTALVGGGREWVVMGRQAAWVIDRHGRTRHDERLTLA